MLDNSKGSRKRGKRVLEILKGPKTLLGSKTLFPLTQQKLAVSLFSIPLVYHKGLLLQDKKKRNSHSWKG